MGVPPNHPMSLDLFSIGKPMVTTGDPQNKKPTWWLSRLSKWVTTPVLSGLTLLIQFVTGVITHLLSGMSHKVMLHDFFHGIPVLFAASQLETIGTSINYDQHRKSHEKSHKHDHLNLYPKNSDFIAYKSPTKNPIKNQIESHESPMMSAPLKVQGVNHKSQKNVLISHEVTFEHVHIEPLCVS